MIVCNICNRLFIMHIDVYLCVDGTVQPDSIYRQVIASTYESLDRHFRHFNQMNKNQ